MNQFYIIGHISTRSDVVEIKSNEVNKVTIRNNGLSSFGRIIKLYYR